MQKVAVITLTDLRDKVIDLLHREGVLQVTDAPESVSIDHAEVNFRRAELEFAIAALMPFADKQILASLSKIPSEEQIVTAALHTDIRGIVDELHLLEKEDQEHKKVFQERRGDGGASGPSEAALFPSSVPQSSVTVGDAGVTAVDPVVEASRREAQGKLLEGATRRKALAVELPRLQHALQYLRWLDEKQVVREAMRSTRSTVTLFGWLPKKKLIALEQALAHVSPATAVLKVKPQENEVPPVELSNNLLIKPFESVTTLYGLPLPTELDPTSLHAVFWIIFFALCLTDAGYGLLLAAVVATFLWVKKLPVRKAPLPWLLLLGGIVTFFVSIPFGGWFGMTVDQAPSWMITTDANGTKWFLGQIWNLGETTGIQFLQNLSLALGVAHLCFGMMIGGYLKARMGDWKTAILSDWMAIVVVLLIGWYFLMPADMTAEVRQLSLYGLYASLVLFVIGKGLGSAWYMVPLSGILGLLNFALGMVSNVLSYLRLLALGLVTGALALAVNLVAIQISAMFPSYIGWPVMIIILIVGHVLNIVLNTLGAFIHSGRLQFVEFFSQFFEGGGQPFRPFQRSVIPVS